MPRVSIVSPFRDAAGKIDGYIKRVNGLAHLPEDLRFICVEGDSVDSTLPELKRWQIRDNRVMIVKHDTGRERFPSIVSKARFAHLADVFNAGLSMVDLEWSDYAMFLPSDVEIPPELLTLLIEADKPLIAPMFWTEDAGHTRFYDIWGFRRNGRNFRPGSPTWFKANLPREPIEMDTIGGVILMKAEVIEAGCHYTPEEVDHGLCKMAQEKGFSVWCHPMAHVVHEPRNGLS